MKVASSGYAKDVLEIRKRANDEISKFEKSPNSKKTKEKQAKIDDLKNLLAEEKWDQLKKCLGSLNKTK